MRAYQCKCGESTYYGSGMVPAACEGCDTCNTQYGRFKDAIGGMDYREREPHSWKLQYNVDTGVQDDALCTKCHTTQRAEAKRAISHAAYVEKKAGEESARQLHAARDTAYHQYDLVEEESFKKHKNFPHCDSHVMHAPKECEYCDDRPELQEARIKLNINFTGQTVEGKLQCPAEARRELTNINKWHGNVAQRKY
jgi:hypothetical protein